MADEAKIERLGSVRAGMISEGHIKSEVNEINPIVLGSRSGPPTVLYVSRKTQSLLRTAEHGINKLPSGDEGLKQRLKNIADAYPITFKGRADKKTEELNLDYFHDDEITVADVNGDGEEELILPRNRGGIEVYSAHKQLFRYQPSAFKTPFYDFKFSAVVKARLAQRDVVYYAVNRTLREQPEELKEDARRFYESTDNVQVLRIDETGVRPVVLHGLSAKFEKIFALAVIAHAGQNDAAELIVAGTFAGSRDVYLSRHRAQGELIDTPRKVYVDLGNETYLRFAFAAHATQVLAHNNDNATLYFFTPGKPANWARTVDLAALFADVNARDRQFLGAYSDQATLVALVRIANSVYALDEEQRFYALSEKKLHRVASKTPLVTFTPPSKLHGLETVFPLTEDGRLSLVGAWYRKPQTQPLSGKELKAAAGKFLLEEDMNRCEESRQRDMEFNADNDITAFFARGYCEKNNIACPPIQSMDDIQKKLPGFYKEIVQNADGDLQTCYETSLFFIFENENYSFKNVTAESYRNPEEYKRWLQEMYRPGELVASVMVPGGAGPRDYRSTGMVFISGEPGVPTTGRMALFSGAHGTGLIVAMRLESMKQKGESGYYRIGW